MPIINRCDPWSDGLAKYREAIKISSGLKKNARIQRDAIKALGVDKVYARARALPLPSGPGDNPCESGREGRLAGG